MNLGSVSTAFAKLQSLSGIALDGFLIVCVVVLLTGIALYFGRQRVAAFALSLYPALLLFLYFPFVERFIFFRKSSSRVVISKLLIFAVFLVFAYVVVRRKILRDYDGYESRSITASVIMSIAVVILLLTISYHIIPLEKLYDFSPKFDSLLTFYSAAFWGLLLPLILIIAFV